MSEIRLCFRGWKTGAKEYAFEERVNLEEGELHTVLPQLAERHLEMLADGGMVEIEFLDEPDQLQRFFRFGTDPSRMVQPIRVDLGARG